MHSELKTKMAVDQTIFKYLESSKGEKVVSSSLLSENQKDEIQAKKKVPSTQEEKKDYSEYTQFFKYVEEDDENKITLEVLSQHNIKILNEKDIYNQPLIRDGGISIYLKQHKNHYSECLFDVLIGKFLMTIKMLNIHQLIDEDGDCTEKGSYGEIFLTQFNSEEIGVKRVRLHELKEPNYVIQELRDKDDFANYIQILGTIRQYAIYKICAIYGIGPEVIYKDTYDLVCYKNFIEFHMESCIPVHGKVLDTQTFTKNLKKRLAKLHCLKIVHGDIKIQNIVYSLKKKEYVFIDFGLTESIFEESWEKSFTTFHGTYDYVSDEMRAIQNKKGFVNLYLNDVCGLKKTVAQFEESYYDSVSGQPWFMEFQYSTPQISSKTKQTIEMNIEISKDIYNVFSKSLNESSPIEIYSEAKNQRKKKKYEIIIDELNPKTQRQGQKLQLQNLLRIFSAYSQQIVNSLEKIIIKKKSAGLDYSKIEQTISEIKNRLVYQNQEGFNLLQDDLQRNRKLRNYSNLLKTIKILLTNYFIKSKVLNSKQLKEVTEKQKQILNKVKEKIGQIYVQIISSKIGVEKYQLQQIKRQMKEVFQTQMMKSQQKYLQRQILDGVSLFLQKNDKITIENMIFLIKSYNNSKNIGKTKIYLDKMEENIKCRQKECRSKDILIDKVWLLYIRSYLNESFHHYKQAEKYIKLAMKQAKEVNSIPLQFVLLDLYSKILNKNKDFQSAYSNNQMSRKMKQQYLFPRRRGYELAYYYKIKSIIHIDMNKFQEAIQAIEKTFEMMDFYPQQKARKIYYPDLFHDSLNNLILCYGKTGQYQQSLKFSDFFLNFVLSYRSHEYDQCAYATSNYLLNFLIARQFDWNLVKGLIQKIAHIKTKFIEDGVISLHQMYKQKLPLINLDQYSKVLNPQKLVLVKKVMINIIEQYLPIFGMQFMHICSQVGGYEEKIPEKRFRSLGYLWKYLTLHSKSRQKEEMYKQLQQFVKKLLKYKSTKQAYRFISKYVYRVPDEFRERKKYLFQQLRNISNEKYLSTAEYFNIIWNQKPYQSQTHYEECQGHIKAKINDPIKKLLYLKKLKQIKLQ